MAHQAEPMDVDCMDSDFDNKENTFRHNVPCTEKGYEELDVSELNMKLRYSMTPGSSPMSKSYTACPDNRYFETGDSILLSNENGNLTRSLNSTLTNNDNVIKSVKSKPLQSLPTEHFADGNGNVSILRNLDSEEANVTVTISRANDIDENISLPSSSSSVLHTPEATTPTKDIKEEASPIMRGLKSVLNMFRSSTSPVPPIENDNLTFKQEVLSPESATIRPAVSHAVASTPIVACRTRDSNTSKRNSPYKDSIVFNDDLEKELNWKDEKRSCSPEKTPINKLLFQQKTSSEHKSTEADLNNSNAENNYHSIVEYMDISNNGSLIQDRTMTECLPINPDVSIAAESDGEFVDCETTFSKNESYVLDIKSIHEKISNHPNVEEKQIKNREFVDCNSTFSVDESYVLDVKEILEKVSGRPNLDQTKPLSGAIENTSIVNQTIDPNETFATVDEQFDTTLPSNYSDYSHATVEILSELDKLENMSSEVVPNTNMVIDSTNHKDLTEEQTVVPDLKIENFTLNDNLLENVDRTADVQDNKANVTENSHNELEDTLTHEHNLKIAQQINESNNELEHENSENQQVNSAQVGSATLCELATENSSQTHYVDLKQEINSLEDSNKIENINDKKEIISQVPAEVQTVESFNALNVISKLTDTISLENSKQSSENVITVLNEFVELVPSDTLNIIQNYDVSIDVENKSLLNLEQESRERTKNDTVVPIDFEASSVEISDIIQNDVFSSESVPNLSTSTVLLEKVSKEFIENSTINTNDVAKIMPKNKTDIVTVDCIKSSQTDTAPSATFEKPIEIDAAISEDLETVTPKSVSISDVVQNDISSVDIVSCSNNIVLSEVVFTTNNSVLQKSLEISHVDLYVSENVDLQNNDVTATQTSEVHITENPCDVPLPDDDIDQDFVNKETVLTFDSEADMSCSDSKVKKTVLESLVDSLVEHKVVDVSFETLNISDVPLSNDDIKSTDIEKLQSLSNKQNINNEVALSELNNLTLKTDNLEKIPLVTDLNSTDIPEVNLPGTKPENEAVGDNNLPCEIIFSSNITCNQSNNNFICDNALTDYSGNSSSDHKTNIQKTCNVSQNINASQIEPMDISLSESLNLTHELPELVNQTIVFAVDSIKTSIVESNEPKQIELAPTPGVINVESLTNITTNNTFETESNLEPKYEVIETNPVYEDLITSEEKHFDEKQPANGTIENSQINATVMNLSYDQPPKVFTNSPDLEPMEIEGTEELIVSENNSPYVSLISGVETSIKNVSELEKAEEERREKNEPIEDIENQLVDNSKFARSPPITSKGYNFNFDDIDDPFATKTKIRMSPPLDSSNKKLESDEDHGKPLKVPSEEVHNRRRSQPPERKKPTTLKNKLNASFHGKAGTKTSTNEMDITATSTEEKNTICTAESLESEQSYLDINKVEVTNVTQTQKEGLEKANKKEVIHEEEQDESKVTKVVFEDSEENKLSNDSNHTISENLKTTSSSEQSTYYSAVTSSAESIQSKNVFNLPEIDDVNFNPFATKTKMRQSPTLDIENPFATRSKVCQSPPPSTTIDNPFATRSKVCQSPPPSTISDNPFATRSKIRSSPDVSLITHSQLETNRTITLDESSLIVLAKNIDSEDKMETELMEKDTSANTADTTSSSRATDIQNLTTREVNTEDEDTIEGPFLDADDDIDKMTDFVADNEDMMQFNELHDAQTNAENLDGELFIDAEAFEFLLNQNKSNVVADSGKESLFLKFDPLFAKRISSDSVIASLNIGQKRQSTPTKPSRTSLRNQASPIAGPSTTQTRFTKRHIEASPVPGPSTLSDTYEGDNNVSQESNDDANITVTKPMMVVTPAFNPAVTPRNKSITPVRSNRRSVTFTSPAIAVIDRLLSMSANNTILSHDSTITSAPPNGEQTEADTALTQLRELLAEKEISVYNLRSESKELKDRLSTMESQVRILEVDGQERLKKINELNERLVEKTKLNKSMAAVVEEYERTIASLIADIEQDKKRNAEERIRLIGERDEQTAHLASMEVSFSDLHSKYEKSKQVILTCKANEDIFRKTIQDFEEKVAKMQSNYEMLKQHATAKLNQANQELEKINRAHEAEVVKLNAMIKRNQLLATSLQESLTQKTKANDELTAICDELINKVGSHK